MNIKPLKHSLQRVNTMSLDEWLKTIAVRPSQILVSNSKLKRDGIYNITMPAQHSIINKHGLVNTCQSAGSCRMYCYSSMGAYIFAKSMIKHARNLDYLMNDPFNFTEQLVNEINTAYKLHKVRIHDSGDFTDASWSVFKEVMNRLPHIKFYAYTKRVSFFKSRNDIPSNFTYVFSYGGTEDHLIDRATDRHAVIFQSRKELRKAGYVEAYKSDIPASNPKTRKVGLIVHASGPFMKRASKVTMKVQEKARVA